MNRKINNTALTIIALLVFWPLCSFTQTNIANYDMQIKLDNDQKTLEGVTNLSWTNTSDTVVTTLQFHLYYNAFRNNLSTFFSEGTSRMRLVQDGDACNWSWSEIKEIKDGSGNPLSMTFIQPDDQNINDKTVLKVSLVEPVLAGESHDFNFNWHAKIPKIMPRTGYNKDYLFMAQWFPKLGVFESKGMRGRDSAGWSCHQYHSAGEYYSNFGNYNVEITVPSDLILGASGLLLDKKVNGNETKWTYEAKSVIDFTWTASPHYIKRTEEWNGIELEFICYPEHEHFSERYFSSIKFALEFLTNHVGAYPYPKLTILDVPLHGLFTGGMEYPMLITSFGLCFFPKKIRTTEILAIHEFIHQYFMQMVATNEAENPWMDEGITTYYESRICDKYYGDNTAAIDVFGIGFGAFEYNRHEHLSSPYLSVAPGNYKSWEYPNDSYGDIAYNKTAMVLKTLEGIIGQNLFDECMKTYFEKWKFKHPGPQDFIDVFNKVSSGSKNGKFPDGLDWYFDQTLFSEGYCDYSVASIENNTNFDDAGIFNPSEECKAFGNENASGKYKSRVIVLRQGTMQLPTDIKLMFEDNSEQIITWDGKEISKTLDLLTNVKIVSAEVDPTFKLNLDVNRLNNGIRVNTKSVTVSKYGKKIQSIFQLIFESIATLIL